jgi:hypothetical protein
MAVHQARAADRHREDQAQDMRLHGQVCTHTLAWPESHTPFVLQLWAPCTGQELVPHSPSPWLQVTSHWHDCPHEVVPHAPEPLQLSVHLPVPQVRSPHAPPFVHVRSHAPVVQLTVPHALDPEPEPVPVQPTVQSASPQVTSPHAPSMPHVTLHDCAPVHVTPAHAPAVAQVIVQLKPAGQVTAAPVPLIMQVLVSLTQPPLHSVGQKNASGGAASGGPSIAASSFAPGSKTQ